MKFRLNPYRQPDAYGGAASRFLFVLELISNDLYIQTDEQQLARKTKGRTDGIVKKKTKEEELSIFYFLYPVPIRLLPGDVVICLCVDYAVDAVDAVDVVGVVGVVGGDGGDDNGGVVPHLADAANGSNLHKKIR